MRDATALAKYFGMNTRFGDTVGLTQTMEDPYGINLKLAPSILIHGAFDMA